MRSMLKSSFKRCNGSAENNTPTPIFELLAFSDRDIEQLNSVEG